MSQTRRAGDKIETGTPYRERTGAGERGRGKMLLALVSKLLISFQTIFKKKPSTQDSRGTNKADHLADLMDKSETTILADEELCITFPFQ